MPTQIAAALRRRLPRNIKARALSLIPILGRRYRTHQILTHPFDREFGTDTSGQVSPDHLTADLALASQMQAYIGAQPSIVRRVLACLPDPTGYAFVDIGCGKGRPLVVASETRFASITGVEISSDLIRVARHNAATIARRFPTRTTIAVVEGNATEYRLGHDRVVLFYYHAFGRDALSTFVASMERQLGDRRRHVLFVYVNPVDADVLDASPSFSRWMTEAFPYAPEEIGFGPDTHDTVAIWQSMPSRYAPLPSAARRLTRVNPMRAEIDD